MTELDVVDNNQSAEAAPLTKAERRKLEREERQRQREHEAQARQHKRFMKKVVLWSGVVVVIVLIGWLVAQLLQPNPDLISRRGIHWHADLVITVKGQPVEIPTNIGLGAIHADMHTHKVNDQIHLEMQRPVRKEDTRLGKFFAIWGKQFNSSCILDSCNGPEDMVKMFVNGHENTEFENYLIQDKDRIEIRYE